MQAEEESEYHSTELKTLPFTQTVAEKLFSLKVVQNHGNAVKNCLMKKDLMIWCLKMKEFSFSIEHRPGMKMPSNGATSTLEIYWKLKDPFECLQT